MQHLQLLVPGSGDQLRIHSLIPQKHGDRGVVGLGCFLPILRRGEILNFSQTYHRFSNLRMLFAQKIHKIARASTLTGPSTFFSCIRAISSFCLIFPYLSGTLTWRTATAVLSRTLPGISHARPNSSLVSRHRTQPLFENTLGTESNIYLALSKFLMSLSMLVGAETGLPLFVRLTICCTAVFTPVTTCC
jgi:hypothetical protein